jgi:hypothetical protein
MRSPGTSVGGRLARVEELLNVRATSSTATSRSVHRGQQISRNRTVELSENWPARPIESPRRQSDVESQDQDDDRSPFDHDPIGDVDCMSSKGECTKGGPEKFGPGTKGMGSLVVNERGDLQYLGKIKGVLVMISDQH